MKVILRPRVRANQLIAGLAAVMACSVSSGAFAQATPANCTVAPIGTLPVASNGAAVLGAAGGAAASLAGTIGNVNTAFLTQQGSAFVSAPANPAPDQPGGGVWVRAIGGEVKTTSTSTGTLIGTNAGAPDAGAANSGITSNCGNVTSQNFAGVQVGADIARLNWNGWNVHLGTTVGYLGANSTDNSGFSNTFQVPFFGTYLVATKGRFFADLMVREEFYNISLTNPNFSFNRFPVGAHGYSIAASTGYNFDMGNSWFIEPSAGFIYSKTSVDNFTVPGSSFATGTNGIVFTASTNDVISEIGRASIRVGKTFETPTLIWQPFASASVFHEFAGNVTSTVNSLPNGLFFGGVPTNLAGVLSTSRIGTYGQYSLGVSAQVVNTGWLGFVRLDYREGDHLQGWTGNAGVRYQFTPEMIASVMPTKAMKAPASFIPPTNWTGFYVGGVAGVAYGRTDIGYVTSPIIAGSRPWVFGGLGGVEAGYNRQINNWVFGVEGDIVATNTNGARTAGTNCPVAFCFNASPALSPFFSAGYTAQDTTNWMGTATARIGYAVGRTLFYVKGGGAFEDSTVATTCRQPQPPALTAGGFTAPCTNQAGVATNGFQTTSTRVGWTVGFGSEFDLGRNWSAKTEWDYLSFGSHTATNSDGTTITTDKSYINQVKVGLNYRFAPTAVVAKY
jgi:opacity protein-like surface antigen